MAGIGRAEGWEAGPGVLGRVTGEIRQGFSATVVRAAVNRIGLDPGNALKGGGALAHSKNVLESHRVQGMVRLGQ